MGEWDGRRELIAAQVKRRHDQHLGSITAGDSHAERFPELHLANAWWMGSAKVSKSSRVHRQ